MNQLQAELAESLHSNRLAETVPRLDWECTGQDTRYLTHPLHRYSSKFIPQIARQAIMLTTSPGELVLDPFCGSGTVLVEAGLLGRRGIGVDLNPLAVMISKAKVAVISPARLKRLLAEMRARLTQTSAGQTKLDTHVEVAVRESEVDDDRAPYSLVRDPAFSRWFRAEVLSELLNINRELDRIEEPELRRLARVALSDVLRPSSKAHAGYPNVMYDETRKGPDAATPLFLRRLEEFVNASLAFQEAMTDKMAADAALGDARRLPLSDASVDSVVTHPPYISSVPYAEYGYLSLRWLGVMPRHLDRVLIGGGRHRPDVVARFAADYAIALEEVHRVLKPGRWCFVLVGDPTVNGERVDLGSMTSRLASSVGLRVEAQHKRIGTNRRANLMRHETLLFLRKS
jgi:SAM-dependent methyltransferase